MTIAATEADAVSDRRLRAPQIPAARALAQRIPPCLLTGPPNEGHLWVFR
jgi:hypothetical protein